MSNRTILIVEDEKDLREVYTLVLIRAGYNVCVAANGKQALDDLPSCRPDLILLDVFMPVMDGKSFLERIDTSLYPAMKVIVFSNSSDQKLKRDMLGLGADDFVTKANVSPQQLTELVGAAMQ